MTAKQVTPEMWNEIEHHVTFTTEFYRDPELKRASERAKVIEIGKRHGFTERDLEDSGMLVRITPRERSEILSDLAKLTGKENAISPPIPREPGETE